jgi:uncharacterized protein YjbJ (UPF0337 family)
MGKKNKVRNNLQVAKGKAKEAAGVVTGNEHLQTEGKHDQMKGHLHQVGEKVNDVFKK